MPSEDTKGTAKCRSVEDLQAGGNEQQSNGVQCPCFNRETFRGRRHLEDDLVRGILPFWSPGSEGRRT